VAAGSDLVRSSTRLILVALLAVLFSLALGQASIAPVTSIALAGGMVLCARIGVALLSLGRAQGLPLALPSARAAAYLAGAGLCVIADPLISHDLARLTLGGVVYVACSAVVLGPLAREYRQLLRAAKEEGKID
jgi:hypothetical protein